MKKTLKKGVLKNPSPPNQGERARVRGSERGFSLITAIFLLVVLTLLGAYMVRISGVQRATANFAVQGARAYYAARSGVEWGVYQAIKNNTCSGAPVTFPFTGVGLQGFQASVTCTSTSHREKNATFNVYVITSKASYGSYGTLDYVSRTLQVTVSPTPP